VVKVRTPVEKVNAAVRDGGAGGKIQQILEKTPPAATYF
jgi:hypothetical protein